MKQKQDKRSKMEILTWRLAAIFVIINFVFMFTTSKFLKINAELRYHLMLCHYLLVAETMFLLLSGRCYKRIVEKWPKHTIFGFGLRLFLAPVFILAQGVIIFQQVLGGTEPKYIGIIFGYAFGFVMFWMATVILFELGCFLWWCLVVITKRNKNSKRVIFRNATLEKEPKTQELIFFVLTFTVTIIWFFIGAKRAMPFPDVRRIKVPVKNLPIAFNDTIIVQLSDMHIGVLNGRTAVEKVVSIANSLKPDIIAITGDTVEGNFRRVNEALQPLRDLKAKYGTFITTGNHDYYSATIDKWIEVWTSHGLVVLHNSKVEIKTARNEKIYLAGIDDTEGKIFRGEHHGPHYQEALQNRDPKVPTILLSHRPSVSKKAMSNYGNIQLALSGHTHGGQFPISGLYHYFSEPYFCGLYEFDKDSFVYVSTGVFYWAAPLRLGSRGEIAHITLVSA